MKVFVWEYVEKATQSYHDGGGLMVIDDSLEGARLLIAAQAPECEALEQDPDYTWEVDASEPMILVFPDAGCC